MNKVFIMGYLGRDPETKYTTSGVAVCNFSVATTRRTKSGDETTWHNCVAFDKKGEAVGKYMSKGSKILVEGRIQVRNWEDKDGNKRTSTDIVVEQFEFADSAKSGKPAAKPSTDEIINLDEDQDYI